MCQNGSGLKFSIQTPAAPLVLLREDEYVPTVRTYVRTYMTCKMLAAHVCDYVGDAKHDDDATMLIHPILHERT